MPKAASSSQDRLARRVLVAGCVVGMVVALLAGAFAPALPGSAGVVRAVALGVGVVCVVGVVVLMRPRAVGGTPRARPVCPQCGFELTSVAAGVSGRTTCPSCEMTWAFERDRAVWREATPRAETPIAEPATPIPFPGRRPAGRSVRRARWRALTRWVAIVIVYLLVAHALAYAIVLGLGMSNLGQILVVYYVLAVGVPLGIAVVGLFAMVRAGRG